MRALLTGHTDRVSVAIGRVGDRDVIVSGGDDHTVRIWDPHTGQPVGAPLTGHTGRVSSVAIGRVGDRDVIVSGGHDATVRIWDPHTGQPVGAPLTGHTGSVLSVAIGRVGDRDVIVSGDDGGDDGDGDRRERGRAWSYGHGVRLLSPARREPPGAFGIVLDAHGAGAGRWLYRWTA
jgi:WD40 repeat protein